MGDFGISEFAQGLQMIGSNNFQMSVNRAERNFQREMADYMYQKDLEMWHEMNRYNDPSHQVARLKQAGLNPALMYGKSASPGIAGQPPNYKAPTEGHFGRGIQMPNMSDLDIIGTFQDVRIKEAQLDNIKAQKNLINNQALVALLNADIKDAEANWRKTVWQDPRSGKQTSWIDVMQENAIRDLQSMELSNRLAGQKISEMMNRNSWWDRKISAFDLTGNVIDQGSNWNVLDRKFTQLLKGLWRDSMQNKNKSELQRATGSFW